MIRLTLHLLTILRLLSAEQAADPYTVAITVTAAHQEAAVHGIDPADLLAVAWVESRFSYRAGCHHPRRGCGIYQQVPAWSGMWSDDCWDGPRQLCRQPGGEGVTVPELLDVRLATRVAARHIATLQRRHGSDWAAAYNGGHGGRATPAARAYAVRVARIRERIAR